MRFGVPLSDSDTQSDSDEEHEIKCNKSHELESILNSPRHRKSKNTSSSNLTSTPTKSSLMPPVNSSLPSLAKKAHSKLNQSGGPYSVGLPVAKSETTPSPFAVVPQEFRSSATGFPNPRSTSRFRRGEYSTISSDEHAEDGHDDNENLDSEEEQWPIRRLKSGSLQNGSDAQSVSYVLPDHDALLDWEQQAKHSTYQLSIRNAAARRRHFEGIHVRTLAQANETSERFYKQKVDELSEVLNRIGLDKERETGMIAEGFEKRERERARAFEALISEAEKLEQEEVLRQNRIKQEEAARKAELERQQVLKQQLIEENIAREARLKQQQEEELNKQIQQRKKIEELKISESKSFAVKGAHDNYEKWYMAIQHVKNTVLPTVSSRESFKSCCRQAKRKITPKVGQLTNGSCQIERVIVELGEVFKGTKKEDSVVYLWACNHLAKALIKQAEEEVTAKLSTVYPLARVVVGLILIGYPEIGDILMARLVKKCYFVAAYRPTMKEGQSEAEYRKQLGYQPEHSSPEESRIQYNNRMAGIVALYAAIQQIDPNDVVPYLKGRITAEKIQRIPQEFRLGSSWNWISNMLKNPMIGSTSTPRVLTAFLEVTGPRLYQLYRKQFIKLVKTILENAILKPDEKSKFSWDDLDCKPSIFQLQGVLEDFLYKDRLQEDNLGRFYELTYE